MPAWDTERIKQMKNKMKIVFLDAASLGSASLDPIRQFGELVTYPVTSAEEAPGRVRDADVLIINKVKVTDELIAAAPELKLICEAATGVNNIDLEAAARRGIPVRNVAGYSTDSVAQLAFTQILSLMCGTRRLDAEVKDGSYSRSGLFTDVKEPFTELAGKTLGIIGMGNIGRKVAAIGEAFGMEVMYYSTSGTAHCTEYPSVSLEGLLTVSDVISIHAPLNARTEGLIGARELAMMKPTAVIVNMARGGIIKEQALADAISEGTIAGAAVDVFTQEPLPEDNPLLHTARPERLLFTPHTAWASTEAIGRLIDGIAANIGDFVEGK